MIQLGPAKVDITLAALQWDATVLGRMTVDRIDPALDLSILADLEPMLNAVW